MPKEWWKNIDIPKLPARNSDGLVYTLVDPNTCKKEGNTEQACFSGARNLLDKRIWDVAPGGYSNQMGASDYLKWVHICKLNGVMPSVAEAYVEGNKLKIQMAGSYHQVFAGLNCYRWAMNTRVLPELVLRLLAENETISFFQAFHYALRKYNHWSNHSFSDGINPSAYYGVSANDLWMSLAMCYFFRDWQNKDAPCHVPNPANAYTMTWTAIQNYWNKNFGIKSLAFKKDEDVLWEEWTDLYNMENPNKNKIQEYYKKVKK